ncbi:PadR family transcriptional regulator [Spirosoma linguale]|uniref:Transcriptional regulator, PadR-like family n=1 Tax=Spirosoma linguale (strain ATCC 33905 / DSM 74 / LMG 10896 / Claus 1) TaxID=504472 RepID=D2QHL5_SPILD|nr:transcriptional regulator, PadR-like family [Spirosoma linguale DSM 74]
MSEINKELIAATLVPLVLTILADGESYGYEIIRNIRLRSAGQLDVAEGTLYPVLRKLEQRGLVQTQWRTADNERQRKYYALKTQGREVLQAERANWNMINQLLQSLWTTNPTLT